MNTENNSSRRNRTIGWVLSILAILFLLFDATGKLMKTDAVMKGTVQLGYPESVIVCLGLILLVCTILYAIPRVSFLGAVLLTGYLGGAVATNVRVLSPLFSNILFPIYVAILVWGGLYLRNQRLRNLITHKNN